MKSPANSVKAQEPTDDAYERARASALALMNRGFHLAAARPVSRDELHQR